MSGEFRCHWTHRHGPHDWTPLVADPEQPRVLHLLDQQVRCPGNLAASAAQERNEGETDVRQRR